MNPDEEIMTIEEVAKYLKMRPQTIYKWAQEGKLPGAKLGKEWRFRKHLLDEWIDSSIVRSKGGFDLLVQSSMLEFKRSRIGEDDLEKLLKEAMN